MSATTAAIGALILYSRDIMNWQLIGTSGLMVVAAVIVLRRCRSFWRGEKSSCSGCPQTKTEPGERIISEDEISLPKVS